MQLCNYSLAIMTGNLTQPDIILAHTICFLLSTILTVNNGYLPSIFTICIYPTKSQCLNIKFIHLHQLCQAIIHVHVFQSIKHTSLLPTRQRDTRIHRPIGNRHFGKTRADECFSKGVSVCRGSEPVADVRIAVEKRIN